MDKKMKHQIDQNIRSHDKYSDKYEDIQGTIFTRIEQGRIHNKLKYAIKNIKTNSNPKVGFDYGCGSGNLTKHLIELGVHTIAADVSNKFLKLIEKKHSNTGMVEILQINGQDLSNIKDNYYDLVATYSVLHHVPDYLRIVLEMVRVLKHGGIIYLDHEVNESYWDRTENYIEFLKLVETKPKRNWKKFLELSYYINKLRKIANPRFHAGGDLHVWPDDHIEWDKIENILAEQGCEIILKEDHLLYVKGYPLEIYDKYKNKCSDVRLLIARKK